MTTLHGAPADLVWHKSSYSDGEGAECVETAADAAAVHVRDSKDPGRPHLTFPRGQWTAFLTATSRL